MTLLILWDFHIMSFDRIHPPSPIPLRSTPFPPPDPCNFISMPCPSPPTSTHWRLCGVWLTYWWVAALVRIAFPSPSNYQMPMASARWLCAHLPLHAGIGFGLGLHRPRACCGNFREFTCASAPLLLENSSHGVIHHLQLLRPFQCPLLHRPRAV